MSSVVITQADKIGESIEEALSKIDLEPIVRGKHVAVKPNETYATEQDKTGVTQPDTLRAVLQGIKRFGPRELVVSGGSGAGETEDIFRVVGLMDVVREEGVEFFDHNRPPFERIELDGMPKKNVGDPPPSVMVNPRVLQYESLISLAQLKVHGTATVTLSLKNIAMSFPAADYYGHPRGSGKQKHVFFDDLQFFIAAMARRFPIALSIIAGHPAMIGQGPLNGYTFETGLIVASADPLAADVVGAHLLGMSVNAVQHLWEAGKLGVGEWEIEKMDFPALQPKEAFGIFTEKAYGKRL